MKMEVYYRSKLLFNSSEWTTLDVIRDRIQKTLGLKNEDFYLLSNGRILDRINEESHTAIHVIPRILGGKGGFGSMLRAIGAQIEKTTNREACRDLSGRRLRDINEEQRLKNWIATQEEREREAAEKRRKKLERLCEKPSHEFKDENYEKERSVLPELVEDAVMQGMKASCSGIKRKSAESKPVVKKKVAKLWMDEDFDDLSSSEEEENTSQSEGKSRSDSNSGETILTNVETGDINEKCSKSNEGKSSSSIITEPENNNSCLTDVTSNSKEQVEGINKKDQ